MDKYLLYAQGLRVSFDGFVALDLDIFELERGELRVIIGPNGAGKTTFMDVLCGKTKPDSGQVIMDDVDLTKLNEKKIVEAGVGRKFQAPTVFGSLTVFDNLLLACKGNKGVIQSLFYRIDTTTRNTIEMMAATVGLQDRLIDEARKLPHGQKQWLEIAMVLLQDPKLLLVDEPTAGMTDEETCKTGELLQNLAGKHTIIVIEHDMEFVRRIARTVSVFSEGKLLVEGPMEVVEGDPRVIECYLGSRE